MQAFRLCHEDHAPFDGSGAAQYGGRWNPAGLPVVYAATSRALTVLERLVHNPVWMPRNDVLWMLELPDEFVHVPAALPDLSSESATQEFGAEWIRRRGDVAMLIPSLVVDGEANLLFNPGHPAMRGLHPEAVARPFRYDGRLRPPSILEADTDERLRIRGTGIEAWALLSAYDAVLPFNQLRERFPSLSEAKIHEALGLLLRPAVHRQVLKAH